MKRLKVLAILALGTIGAMSQRPDPSPEAVAFIWDQVKDAPDRCVARAKSLEARGAQAFSAATVLVGLGGLTNLRGGHVPRTAIAFLALGALAYVLAAVSALRLLRPSYIHNLPEADAMWRDYRLHDVAASKAAIIEAIARDARVNRDMVEAKANQAEWAVRWVAVEGVALAVALLLSVVTSAS
jgi:hypothetical protein